MKTFYVKQICTSFYCTPLIIRSIYIPPELEAMTDIYQNYRRQGSYQFQVQSGPQSCIQQTAKCTVLSVPRYVELTDNTEITDVDKVKNVELVCFCTIVLTDAGKLFAV